MKSDNPKPILRSAEEVFRGLAAVEQVSIAPITPDEKIGLPLGEDRAQASKPIFATPYVYKDPTKIPLRKYLYGKSLIRKFVSVIIGQTGLGKSTLSAGETLAQVSAKGLLGVPVPEPLRVWLWNLEDPQEETERKLAAAMLHYGLTAGDIGDRLFVDSGRDQPLVIAEMTRNGAMIVHPVVDSLVAELIKLRIDIIKIDPSCHPTRFPRMTTARWIWSLRSGVG
jgi:hypothetical protein